MNLNSVLSKTPKGVEEIETRKYKLDQRSRGILIVVNGKTTGTDLVKKFAQITDITPTLVQLVSQGYIAEAAGSAALAGAGFEDARGQLSRTLSDALGPAADGICMKLEECESAQELRQFLEQRRAMLESTLGRKSGMFWAKAKELLG